MVLQWLDRSRRSLMESDECVGAEEIGANIANGICSHAFPRCPTLDIDSLDDFTCAVEDETKALQLKTHPEGMSTLYYFRGLGYKGLWQKDKALADFEEAIRRDPRNYEAYLERGWYRMMDGDHATALADYNVVLDHDPKHAKAWMLRGETYLRKGNVDRALTEVNRSIALEPQSAPAYALRVRIYDNKGKYEQALSDAQKAEELAPERSEYWNTVGWFTYKTGKPAEAIPYFQMAQHLDDDGRKESPMYIPTPYVPFNLGLCHAVLGDVESSAMWYRSGVSNAPLEIVRQALAEVKKALRKQPSSAALHQAVEILQKDVTERSR